MFILKMLQQLKKINFGRLIRGFDLTTKKNLKLPPESFLIRIIFARSPSVQFLFTGKQIIPKTSLALIFLSSLPTKFSGFLKITELATTATINKKCKDQRNLKVAVLKQQKQITCTHILLPVHMLTASGLVLHDYMCFEQLFFFVFHFVQGKVQSENLLRKTNTVKF